MPSPSSLVHYFRHYWRDRRRPLPDVGDPARADTLILVHNSLFGFPLQANPETLPPGCAITANRRWRRNANAVVFHLPTLWRLPRFKREGQLWVAWCMESEEYCPRMADAKFMSRFDLTMTYRLDSDVPEHYATPFNIPNTEQLLAPPDPKSRDQLAVALISSVFHNSGRLELLQGLMRAADVHSYGKVCNNRAMPRPDLGDQTKFELLRGYKFTLALENSIRRDYVTEKLFQPLACGSVPVYLGAPNVEDFLPGDHCCINTRDFRSPEQLAAYLRHLNEDDNAYNEYFAWKRKPLRPQFLRLLEMGRATAGRRLCEKVRQVRRTRGL